MAEQPNNNPLDSSVPFTSTSHTPNLPVVPKDTKKTWFITGCTSGFGLAVALKALESGDKVIATGRSKEKLREVEEKGAIGLVLDMSWDSKKIQESVEEGISRGGGNVDFLLNNAGQPAAGALEEMSDQQFQELFQINVFSHITVTRSILPLMRKASHGTIAFLGSSASWSSNPGFSAYTSSKWALSGLAQSFKDEVRQFNIKVMVFEPGYFRTSFLSPKEGGGGIIWGEKEIEEYRGMMGPMKDFIKEEDGKQPGNVEKASGVMVECMRGEGKFMGKELPARLVLGSDAWMEVVGLLEGQKRVVGEWEEAARSTDIRE